MSFNSQYEFRASGRVVVMKHSHNGHVRVSPNNNSAADGEGGTGGWARWRIELVGGNYCKLQSTKTGKYLRICRGGNQIDVTGGGGPFTKFRIHYHSRPNGVKLESDRFSGRYIAVNPSRGMKIGTGGRHCNLWFWKERGQPQVIVRQQQPQVIVSGGGGGGQFNLNYMFRQNNTVCIRSNYGKHLRVAPGNHYAADGNGGQGSLAHWRVELQGGNRIKLQNTKSGKYLRIQNGNEVNIGGTGGKLTEFRYHVHQSPNGVKLESTRFGGKYVAIRPNGNVMIGGGGIHTKLFFMRQGQQQQVVYQQPQQPQVIIQQPQQPQVIYQQAPQQQPQVIVQQPSPQQNVVLQQQAQQAQLQAQNSANQVQQMQQQMEQMKLQQQQQMEQQKKQMEQQMAQQQQMLQQQQQQVLDAQAAILQQQQASMSQSSLNNVQQPVYQQPQQASMSGSLSPQNEGVNTLPYNPNVIPPQQQPMVQPVQPIQQQPVQQQPVQQQQPAYPVLQPVQPIQPPVEEKQEQEDKTKSPQPLDLTDAEEVKEWLKSLKMERYYDTFIENGYDQLEAIGEISRDDLKEMKVALGHIKIIMNSYLNAPFANKEIIVRTVKFNTYLSNYGPGKKMNSDNGKKVEINHKKKRNEGCVWVFEPIDNRMFYLKNKSTETWLRILPELNKECVSRSPVSPHAQLVLEKVENEKGVYHIKCVSNGFYLSAEKPSTFGKDELKSVNKGGGNEKFQLITIKKIGKFW